MSAVGGGLPATPKLSTRSYAILGLLTDPTQLEATEASIAAAITWADDLQDIGRLVAAEYTTGNGPFQDRPHLVAVPFAFLWEYAEFIRRWASWAQQEVRRWPEGTPGSDVFRRALDDDLVLPPTHGSVRLGDDLAGGA